MIELIGIWIAVVSALFGGGALVVACLQYRLQKAAPSVTVSTGEIADELTERISKLRGARSAVVAAGFGVASGVLIDDAVRHHPGGPDVSGDGDPDVAHHGPDLVSAVGSAIRTAWEFITHG